MSLGMQNTKHLHWLQCCLTFAIYVSFRLNPLCITLKTIGLACQSFFVSNLLTGNRVSLKFIRYINDTKSSFQELKECCVQTKGRKKAGKWEKRLDFVSVDPKSVYNWSNTPEEIFEYLTNIYLDNVHEMSFFWDCIKTHIGIRFSAQKIILGNRSTTNCNGNPSCTAQATGQDVYLNSWSKNGT